MQKIYFLFFLAIFISTQSLCQTTKTQPLKTAKKHTKKPVSTPKKEVLIGKISSAAMTIKIHQVVEVVLNACTKCPGSQAKYTPKPNHRVLLFDITRRNPNSYALNAQIDNCTPLYARIIGTDGVEYPCHTIPSLIELAMAQKKRIDERNAPMYYSILGPAPARSEQRAFAMAIEIPRQVQPKELVWRKGTLLTCLLVMPNNQ